MFGAHIALLPAMLEMTQAHSTRTCRRGLIRCPSKACTPTPPHHITITTQLQTDAEKERTKTRWAPWPYKDDPKTPRHAHKDANTKMPTHT